MSKHLIYVITFYLLISCSNDQDKNILGGSAFICDKLITINDNITDNWITDKNITYNRDVDAYYMSCGKKGSVSIGGELLFVDEIIFRINEDSTVTSIRGFWVDSYINDISSFVYSVNRKIGRPTSINPYRWDYGNTSFSVGAQQVNSTTIKYASISVNED